VHGNDELAALGVTFNQTAARLQEAAQKQRELETLRRDLIAWAGHDLQTPLASIRAIVEALADGVVDDPDISQRYLRTAQRDVQISC
jgi:signal transduction histidine kinase